MARQKKVYITGTARRILYDTEARGSQRDPVSKLWQSMEAMISSDLTRRKNMKDKKANLQGSIEEVLMQELRFGGIDKENLQELVGIVAGIQQEGLKRIKVFPKGQPPIVDGLRVSGILEASEANRFLGEVLMKTPRLGGVIVFPYGIPWPEIFRVSIDLGAPVETGPINQF
jgi:hypothetical protein